MSNAVKITLAVVFILSICFLDIFLGKTTDKLIYETEEKLEALKSALAEKNYDECKKKSLSDNSSCLSMVIMGIRPFHI